MRNAMVALLALSAVTVMAGSSPAAAYDYPYCAQGTEVGVPGECAYTSYEQCMAAASGRLLYCSVNPRAALNQGPPPRRARPYRNY
jgi:hypothetical protein